MAGGRGLRLHPLTEHTPKPLLAVGGKPILEQIVEGFVSQGFKQIWLAVHYKHELIEQHFGNGHKWGAKIRYLSETTPLGTAGALRLLPEQDKPFIVCNGDVLTHLNYGRLMESHARQNGQITACLALHQHQVPFGVAHFNDADELTGFAEKPIDRVLVNAGIYVLEPDVMRSAPPAESFDMTDLIDNVERLGHYPISDFWLDVGTFEAYTRANGAG